MTDPHNALNCALCYLTSGGGTLTPAVVIIGGQSLCARHVDDVADALRPEVTPT